MKSRSKTLKSAVGIGAGPDLTTTPTLLVTSDIELEKVCDLSGKEAQEESKQFIPSRTEHNYCAS